MASVAGGSAAETPPAAPRDPGHASRVPTRRQLFERVISLREGSIIVVTIVTAIYFSANTGSFFTGGNFKTLLPYFAPFAILAAGEVFVMILGEIDLSIGAMYLFAPILFYKLNSSVGLGLVPGVIVTLLLCMLVGALNGFFVAVVGINSFVTTLAMLFTFEGLALIVSHGTPVATPGAALHTTTQNVTHVVNGHTVTLPEQVNHISTFAKVFGGGTYS
ncbi:MAG TPA: ABC transporter permease, partial [Solirubrobacteraceae bacterium]